MIGIDSHKIKVAYILWKCFEFYNTSFFLSNTFIGNKQRQPKTGKKLRFAKQQPVAEHLIFKNYSHSSSENNRTYSKKLSERTSFSVFMRLCD